MKKLRLRVGIPTTLRFLHRLHYKMTKHWTISLTANVNVHLGKLFKLYREAKDI